MIQGRDRNLLKEIASLRVVDREQAKIIGGFTSTPRVNARLLALHRAGLLRRFFFGASDATKKAIYALSPKGAALVGTTHRGLRRPHDALLVADFSILHQLAVNDIHCALRSADETSSIALVRWLSFYESIVPGLRLIPDGYVELTSPAGVICAFLEVDLGHEALRVWKKKIAGYLQLALSGEYERRFAQIQFRVLVIANSEKRLLSIRKTVRAATRKVFWFAPLELIRSDSLFRAVWFRPEGNERHPLIPNIQRPS